MEGLKELGLTGYEAAIYTTLLEEGRSSAKEVSLCSKVPPTAVYPNLDGLIKKGFVQKFEGQIALFEAIPPKLALQSCIRKEAKRMEELGNELIPLLEERRNTKALTPLKEPIVLSTGLEASHEITFDFMERASKSLSIVGWGFSSSYNLYKLLKRMKGAVDRNVEVRMILTRKEKQYKEVLKWAKEYKIQVRFYPVQSFSIIICDGTECKITLKGEDLPDRVNVKIQDLDLSKALEEYFLVLWRKAEAIAL